MAILAGTHSAKYFGGLGLKIIQQWNWTRKKHILTFVLWYVRLESYQEKLLCVRKSLVVSSVLSVLSVSLPSGFVDSSSCCADGSSSRSGGTSSGSRLQNCDCTNIMNEKKNYTILQADPAATLPIAAWVAAAAEPAAIPPALNKIKIIKSRFYIK